jgi:two-component system chemotaxis response regulator CheY
MTHILIVDDANLVRMYYREILQRAGYSVDEALNGLEALEKLLLASGDQILSPDPIQPVDLVLVDINMPKMDGITFLRTLRRQPSAIAAIPAIVTSTEAKPEDAALARTAGANFYLIKPVSPETLLTYAGLMCGTPA